MSAVAKVEAQLALAVTVFRVGGLVGMAWVLINGTPASYRGVPLWATASLVAVVTVESAALCLACRRAHRVRIRWAVGDLLLTAASLVWWRVAAPGNALYFMFPYSLLTSITYGVVLRRAWTMLAATTLVVACNAVPELILHINDISSVVYDGGTYYPNVLMAFAVARAMRSGAVELDQARALAARAAADRLRLQHARALHDRVLQTLEVLAGGPWLAGSPLYDQVVRDSMWLRDFVANADSGQEPAGLLAGLQSLAERNVRDGLRVRLQTTVLEQDPDLAARLDPVVSGQLLAAAGEALANVRKHAGVGHAVLRVARRGDEVCLSVLDQGRGFDPARTAMRTGLRQSVIARIEEIGGRILIESAPGNGAYVELTVPLAEVEA